MRKSLFVLIACCSLDVVCAVGNSSLVVGPRQEFGEDGRIREIMDDTASNDTLVNIRELEDFIDVRQEDFDLVEGPKIPYQHVHVLKACCSLAYAKPFELEEKEGIEPFYRGTNDADKFAGFVKKVSYRVDSVGDDVNTLVVSFPGTRGSTLKELQDVLTDVRAFGKEEGFVNSLRREGVAVHSAFAGEVMSFYGEMLKAIGKYISEGREVREIHFTGHSKGGGEAILTALKFASDVRREVDDGNNIPGEFRYAFKNEAPREVFSLFQSVFGHNNAIKVFTFSAPAVINKNGKDLFYEVIGRRNAICIFKNFDIVPDLPYLAGKGLRPIGIQANISMGSESNYQKEIDMIKANCQEGGWKISESVKDLMVRSHKLDGFNSELIWMIMRRIRGNYENDPTMDESIMGMDREPLFRRFMIWK